MGPIFDMVNAALAVKYGDFYLGCCKLALWESLQFMLELLSQTFYTLPV